MLNTGSTCFAVFSVLVNQLNRHLIHYFLNLTIGLRGHILPRYSTLTKLRSPRECNIFQRQKRDLLTFPCGQMECMKCQTAPMIEMLFCLQQRPVFMIEPH